MIHFFQEDVPVPGLDKDKVSNWIKEVVALQGKRADQINYIFCSEQKILEINNHFLQHNYFTDIISFDYSSGKSISGDLFISPQTIASNAEDLQVNFQQELHRVLIHGVLHLCGYQDKTEKEQQIMRSQENKALEMIDL